MLQKTQFDDWCRKLNNGSKFEDFVGNVRNSPPSRTVSPGRGSMCGRFPSQKMGVTIQFESHRNELPFIHELEHDSDVLEYYDQPALIKLKYKSLHGKNTSFYHTPDFLVLRTDCAEFVECKTEEQLLNLTMSQPNRYQTDSTQTWRCSPGEAAAAELGLTYRVRSSKEINWAYQRNIEFLADYLRADAPLVSELTKRALLAIVQSEPGLTLTRLFELAGGKVCRDDCFTLLAQNEMYIDWCAAAITDFDEVRLFINAEIAKAFSNTFQFRESQCEVTCRTVEIAAGTLVDWNGKNWKVVSCGMSKISLIDDSFAYTEVPQSIFEQLVRSGSITGVSSLESNAEHPEIAERLANASRENLAEANKRYACVIAGLNNEPLPFETKPRTLRDWTKKYREASSVYGRGFIGLLPLPRSGNQNPKLPAATRELMQKFIDEKYETLKQMKKLAVYAMYRSESKNRGIEAATYQTFANEIEKRPNYEQTLKRQGRRAAYDQTPFYWHLELTTPRHGERPFQIAHIDYTEIDLELTDSKTGKSLGRCWAGFMPDAFTRSILAVYSTFDPPSYRSDMMILRECVRRHGRMPQIIVVDGGKNFNSVYFETLLAMFQCTKKTRPPAEARFGSLVERLFGTSNTQFIHNLQGNTQIMKNVRQVTKSVNPKNHAVWTLETFYSRLTEWAYEVYGNNDHPALDGFTPNQMLAQGLQMTGERKHRLISYNDFKLLTLPSTSKGTTKIQPGKGIKVNYFYYWAEAMRHPEVEGTQVPVKYDPFNIGKAYAFIRGKWVECFSGHQALLSRCSERQLKIATTELHRRYQQHSCQANLNAARIADFLTSIESEEVLLRQRVADRESKCVHHLINGETNRLALSDGKRSFQVEERLEKAELPSRDKSVEVIKEFEEYERF